MDIVENRDYESLGDSVMNTYDTLEMTVVNTNRERSDHKNKAGLTEEDGKFLGKRNKLLKKRICAVVTATVMALFVIALAVVVYVFVSSKNEGKNIEIGHCPKYSTNGTVVKTTGSSYGDTIELTCDEKNKLNGPNVITCLSTGNWSAFSQCIPKLCNNFPLSDNMKVESEIKNISVGTIVTVNCEEGFVLTGKNTVVCLTNEKWSDNPSCKVIDCGHPDNVANAVITNISETTYNSIFFVECKKGYIMSGNNIVKCNLYGNWDSMPTCKKVTCGLPTIPGNGSISQISGTSFQATASLKCNEGFVIIGDPIINCLSNGSWSDIPACDIDDCIPDVCGSNGTCVDGVNSYSCSCKSGFGGMHCETGTFTDCFDVLHKGKIIHDGVYGITTWKSHRHVQVYCDMTTAGGRWTVFQNRFDGSVNFYRNFSEYEAGFGHKNGEFWLGLTFIQEIADEENTELRIDLESANGTKAFVAYSRFSLSDGRRYTLHVGNISASSGISAGSLKGYHDGQSFTTYDQDLDSSSRNCAKDYHGGWWYNNCHKSNLNGLYLAPGNPGNWTGMTFDGFIFGESLKCSKMMLRKNLHA